jgi:3-isopropylmalate/(R)-2-methylmalate dehydratase large subunit
MGLSISEKILTRAAGKPVAPGDYVFVKPDLVAGYSGITYFPAISSEAIGATPGLKEVGASSVVIPEKNVVFVDHLYPPSNAKEAENISRIRKAAQDQGIRFYEGAGIGHQVIVEKGLGKPGMLVVHFDGHVSILGAVGAYATSVSLEDLLQCNVTGETWLKVPTNIKVIINSQPPAGVLARDIWHYILADIGPSGAADGVLEFHGSTMDEMSMDGRMTICDLVQFSGAETGIMNPDSRTISYLREKTGETYGVLKSDPDAEYSRTLEYDVSKLEPLVAVPPDVYYIKPVSEVEGLEISQALIGTCASGRLEDLRIAAQILNGKKVHKDVRMFVTPASREIYEKAAEEGLLEILVRSGAIVTHSVCDTCYGRIGYLSNDERCITSAPLNVQGRMGSMDAQIYLGSPAVVAASALEGKITDPRRYVRA